MGKKETEELLEGNLKVLLENAFDAFALFTKEGEILYWNKEAEDLTGYSKEEMLGRVCPENPLPHRNEQGVPLCGILCPLKETLQKGKVSERTILLERKDGKKISLRLRCIPLEKNGKVEAAVQLFTPLEEKGKDQEELLSSLSFYASHDFLTKLPNRLSFESFLKKQIKKRQEGKAIGFVLYLDIDDFKSVNDTFGHSAGDAILKAIGRMATVELASPKVMFSRLGGEEFAVAGEVENKEEAYSFATKAREKINDLMIYFRGQELRITASFGLRMIEESDDIASLLTRSDALMYKAKHNGKNRIEKDF